MTKSKSIIKLKNVWKTYTMGDVQVHALRGLDLEVKEGEFLAIQGPSGSGKSTAMNLIGCLDIPTKGSVFLDNRDISQMSESNLAQIRGKKIGFIFQQFNLINTLSAIENVMLPMMFQGIPEYERRSRGKKLLEMVDLGDRVDHKPKELSGGQQQRVAIARSLVNNPRIILADEPTGNLDSETGEVIMNLFKKLNKEQNVTIIIVTHEPYIAAKTNRTITLIDGKIATDKRTS